MPTASCGGCGKEIASYANYCTHCGTQLGIEHQPHRRVSRIWFSAGIALLVMSAFSWLVVILGALDDYSEVGIAVLVTLIILAIIPTGLGIYLVRRFKGPG